MGGNSKNIAIAAGLFKGYKIFTRSQEEKELRQSAKQEIVNVKTQMKNKSIDKLEGKSQIKNIKLQLKENVTDLKLAQKGL
jgi:hypothetical protein